MQKLEVVLVLALEVAAEVPWKAADRREIPSYEEVEDPMADEQLVRRKDLDSWAA